ncbi:ATP-binding protein [Leptospira idonii]|uniref:ATP-binding protein n=1 Tax=Leptospira idonii TaxID=1193500 RepID=A0A4V3JXM0_9LEPT|nr:ATP-binding protein [Leptospira idonii]TGN17668.1 ATP-binding protein [Leptospira idonii]
MSASKLKKTDYGKVVRIQIPSHPRYISQTRNYFFNLALDHGYTLFDAVDLKLILGEAVSNVIKHAYKGHTDKPIFIDFYFERDRVEIRIRDYGVKTQAKDLKSFDLSDYRESGIGIFLIKHLTDYYFLDQSFEQGNQMVLIKKK